MVRIIVQEFSSLYNNTSVFKALWNYFFDNAFRVQCKIKRISLYRSAIIRAAAIQKLEKQYGFRLGLHCRIGRNLHVHHYNGTIIGEKAVLGNDCHIFEQVNIGSKNNQYPVIGNNVIMYPGCKIVGKVYIGDNAIIGPNSVVVKDIPANAIVSGVPAQIIKWRE